MDFGRVVVMTPWPMSVVVSTPMSVVVKVMRDSRPVSDAEEEPPIIEEEALLAMDESLVIEESIIEELIVLVPVRVLELATRSVVDRVNPCQRYSPVAAALSIGNGTKGRGIAEHSRGTHVGESSAFEWGRYILW
jgi:hypothetical protein